jgi:septum formation protein
MAAATPAARLVLASASPRRHDLLTTAGVEFDVDAPSIDETLRTGERPRDYVARMAREKAFAAARRYPTRPVLAADTIVVLDDRVFGKPSDADDAVRMLEALSGRAHVVMTAVAVVEGGSSRSGLAETSVWFRRLSAVEVRAYVATGEPLDKAGAYAIQGGAGAFVERVDGAMDTVIGLPVGLALDLLHRPAL